MTREHETSGTKQSLEFTTCELSYKLLQLHLLERNISKVAHSVFQDFGSAIDLEESLFRHNIQFDKFDSDFHLKSHSRNWN